MFKELVSLVPGNQVFAIVTMVFFILIFMGIVIWAFRADRSYLDYMKQLPLDKRKKNGEEQDV